MTYLSHLNKSFTLNRAEYFESQLLVGITLLEKVYDKLSTVCPLVYGRNALLLLDDKGIIID